MDIHDYLRLLRRNLVLIVSATLIGLSCGVLVALTTPPRYVASAELLVSVQAGETAVPGDLAQGRTYAQQVVTSYVSVIPSALVLEPVIRDLGLNESAAQLAGRIEATATPPSTAITLTVSHPNPGQAARIANAVGESFAEMVAKQLERPRDDSPSSIRIDILQPALVPETPAAPNMNLSVVLGGLIGLTVGIGVAALRTVLDTRIRSVADVEAVTGVPVLGATVLDPEAKSRPLVVASASRDPRAEAFRSLRTNVQFLSFDGGPGVYVVTSAGPGEGKSTTAANLAIAFAESGARVALLDGDLRLPRVADYFAIEGGVGLSDVLVGRIAASDAMQRWGRGTLFVLPAGTLPPNPAELLGSESMFELLNDLKSVFDIVIIDAPPVLLVTDAAVMSRLANGAIVAVAAGKTTAPRLQAAVSSIETVGAKVLGTVVTMLPTSGADKTHYGVYAYADQTRA